MLITFSGLDGSGKTTLIANLVKNLKKSGHDVCVLTMYDDVSFYSYIRRLRDLIKSKDLQIDQDYAGNGAVSQIEIPSGINPHDPKTDVSDKTGIVMRFVFRIIRNQAMRKVMLMFDLASLLAHRLILEVVGGKILIIDRYLYDSLVDVADLRSYKWFFVKAFIRLVPRPNVPIFVDVSAEVAFQRKKEYLPAYMKWRRSAYQKVFSWIREPVILYNNDLEETLSVLRHEVAERMTS